MAEKTPEQQYLDALAAFQSDMPRVGKEQTATVRSDKGNYSYDYADLTDITDAVLPLLVKQGLTWSAAPEVTEHGFVLRFRLAHVAGYSEGGTYPLPDPARTTAQGIGSAITYGRRYALCAMTGLAPGGDDDEGRKASAPAPAPRAARTRTEPSAPKDDRSVALSELHALCQEKGWEPGPVAATFTAWDDEHRMLGTADAAVVREFAEKLRNGEVVPDGAS